jgi:predicted nucleic acid-binding protein
MRRVVLDTDILSEITKRKDPVVIGHATAYASEHGRFTFSAITAQEVLFGLRSRRDFERIAASRAFFAEHEILIPTLEDYLRAGEIRGAGRSIGKQIALDDCLIGAIAERVGVPVCTGNTTHFEDMRQAGLEIETVNWRFAGPPA